ncbi:thioesterase II family protein [Streptomyces sp. NPDC020898]|uniref:thioesterase II family protein n=1 Tax=Streptomyces sp. NPDC020898 TaxID=3365101 RepID=UPI0037A1704C
MPLPTTAEDPWIRRYVDADRRAEAVVRLVCFPHAGGSAGYFRPLAQALAPRFETLAIQYPGRQDRRREHLPESMAELADAAFASLRHRVEPPFAFFGHSLGAVLAFEVTRRFEQLTPTGPVRLFASARRAPSVARNESVHLLDDRGLIQEIKRLGGTDPAVLDDPELRELVLPVVRADYRAVETYACPPGARVTCPVSVFAGSSDPVTPVEEAAAWGLHTTKEADTRVFDGGHFYPDGNWPALAAAISAVL